MEHKEFIEGIIGKAIAAVQFSVLKTMPNFLVDLEESGEDIPENVMALRLKVTLGPNPRAQVLDLAWSPRKKVKVKDFPEFPLEERQLEFDFSGASQSAEPEHPATPVLPTRLLPILHNADRFSLPVYCPCLHTGAEFQNQRWDKFRGTVCVSCAVVPVSELDRLRIAAEEDGFLLCKDILPDRLKLSDDSIKKFFDLGVTVHAELEDGLCYPLVFSEKVNKYVPDTRAKGIRFSNQVLAAFDCP